MLVDLKHGKCRECGGQLQIIGADDATMIVQCQVCGESYEVETDAFDDGAMHYWPNYMAEGDGP